MISKTLNYSHGSIVESDIFLFLLSQTIYCLGIQLKSRALA